MSRKPKPAAKQLVAEALPAPGAVIPSVAPRACVSNHLRSLLSLGAASASLSCAPMVCDPLPPPAQCHNTGSVLSSIEVSTAAVSGTAKVDVVVRPVDTYPAGAVGLTLLNVTGGTAAEQPPAAGIIVTERVTPNSSTGVIELSFSATCEGAAAAAIHVVLTPTGPDAGTADGGTATYAVSITEQ